MWLGGTFVISPDEALYLVRITYQLYATTIQADVGANLNGGLQVQKFDVVRPEGRRLKHARLKFRAAASQTLRFNCHVMLLLLHVLDTA